MNSLKKPFKKSSAVFVDQCNVVPREIDYWEPVIISGQDIDAEVERLCAVPPPQSGIRQSLIVHPKARASAPGLAPGIGVSLQVLLPGESTKARRHNASDVNFCIRGAGRSHLMNRTIEFKQYDVWNTPSYQAVRFENHTDSVQVRLTYSNAPLLQNMEVYIHEDDPILGGETPDQASFKAEPHVKDARHKNPFGMFPIGEDGGLLMPYETLINPDSIDSGALHFPWSKVKPELDKLEALGSDYVGRRLYMMYNPATGRMNGITPSFFATMTLRPGNIVDRPHRHVSAAINYYFSGSGYSSVAGNRYEWKAGDLMLSAPGWAVHNHASYDEPVYELTVQDQPLNIYMESLLWQESLKEKPIVLGTRNGFTTNRWPATNRINAK